MFTRLTTLLRAAALAGATVGLSACVAEPYGYSTGYVAPAYGVAYGGGGYYGGGYRSAPVFATAGYGGGYRQAPAFRPVPVASAPFMHAPRPMGGLFGGGGGFAPRVMAPPQHHGGGFGGFAPRGPMGGGGGGGVFHGRPHHHR